MLKKLFDGLILILLILALAAVPAGCSGNKEPEQDVQSPEDDGSAGDSAGIGTVDTQGSNPSPSPVIQDDAGDADPAAEPVMPVTDIPGERKSGGNAAIITNVPENSGTNVIKKPEMVPSSDGSYHVHNIEQLLAAIAPGASIVLEAGSYNLTDFLSPFSNKGYRSKWNFAYEYIEVEEVFDGVEIIIENVDGLKISGGTGDPAETVILTMPRYAAVLKFKECSDIELSCLTMGHTKTGECAGNVLDFYSCSNINLRSMDLFGCGVNGIGMFAGSGDLYVTDSTVRDCSSGPFEIYEPDGEICFTSCVLTGSSWGGYFNFNDRSKLSFIGCIFGRGESEVWYHNENAFFENCSFSDIL